MVGDVLEVNLCSQCHLVIVLLDEVGWLHVPTRPWHPEWNRCATPEPRWRRCGVCRTLADATPAGLMDPHTGTSCAAPGMCAGVGLPGMPVRSEDEAFRENPR